MTKHFMVEATVNLEIPANVDTNDRRAVRDWLNAPFFHHDRDYTIQNGEAGEEIEARVMYDLELDLTQVQGDDFALQLKSFHKMAIQEMATSLNIDPSRIHQLDVLVTDRP